MAFDPYAEFREMTKFEQKEHLLDIACLCNDGAPKSLARKIEIFLDATEEDQKFRRGSFR